MIVIPAGRDNKFEVAIVVMLAISGGFALLPGVSRSGAVTALLPGAWATAFYAALVIGALVTLFGLYLPLRFIVGPLVECAGLIALAGQLTAYAAAITIVGGARGAVSAAICLAISWACVDRILTVIRLRRKAGAL